MLRRSAARRRGPIRFRSAASRTRDIEPFALGGESDQLSAIARLSNSRWHFSAPADSACAARIQRRDCISVISGSTRCRTMPRNDGALRASPHWPSSPKQICAARSRFARRKPGAPERRRSALRVRCALLLRRCKFFLLLADELLACSNGRQRAAIRARKCCRGARRAPSRYRAGAAVAGGHLLLLGLTLLGFEPLEQGSELFDFLAQQSGARVSSSRNACFELAHSLSTSRNSRFIASGPSARCLPPVTVTLWKDSPFWARKKASGFSNANRVQSLHRARCSHRPASAESLPATCRIHQAHECSSSAERWYRSAEPGRALLVNCEREFA